MTPIAKVIAQLIDKYGGVKSKISDKLGRKPDGTLWCSPQKLGHYAKGKYLPKSDFLKRWKEVYKDDIEALASNYDERNVSRETRPEVTSKEMFDKAVDNQAITQELWRQLQEDHKLFEKELERAWSLIDRLLPPGGGHSIQRVLTKNR